MEVICVTGNESKFAFGQRACREYGVELIQKDADIDEVQGEDPAYIVKQKVLAAFQAVDQPVVVTDDSWEIPGLNGFPGPYMKSMTKWFTTDDWVRLTENLEDKSAYVHQYLAYTDDGVNIAVFNHYKRCILQKAPRGLGRDTWARMICVEGEEDLTVAERQDQGDESKLDSKKTSGHWHEFAQWLIANS